MRLPIRPELLVEHAELLARYESPSGRPHITWLRRSTSASYYAVFHAIALAVARQLCASSTDDDRRRLTRSVEHGRVRQVCEWLGRPGASREQVDPIVVRLRRNPALVELGKIFVVLQDARHKADYDHLAAIRKDALRDRRAALIVGEVVGRQGIEP